MTKKTDFRAEFEDIHALIRKNPLELSLQYKYYKLILKSNALRSTATKATRVKIHETLSLLFEKNDAVPQYLVSLALSKTRQDYNIEETTSPFVEESSIEALSGDRLFLAALKKGVNTDRKLEFFLSYTRHYLLCQYVENRFSPAFLPLVAALAEQCFNNEYVINETEEELEMVQTIGRCLGKKFNSDCANDHQSAMLIWGMYFPLTQLSCVHAIAETPLEDFSEIIRPIIRRVVHEPLEEDFLAAKIPSFGNITCPVSQAIRTQYEENPYPRWFQLNGKIRPLRRRLKEINPDFSWPIPFSGEKTKILVPGCGTGRHPLQLAAGNPDADILAMDLSKKSLAYGKRMAKHLGIHNVTFLHGDLLEVPKLNLLFHHIDCCGTLHHIADPIGGWRKLNEVLHAGGTLHIGVYSKTARIQISLLRNMIAKLGIKPNKGEMKQFRFHLLSQKKFKTMLDLIDSLDFYSLGMFRDLLFHVSEYCYQLSELNRIFEQLKLEFLGFKLKSLKKKYLDLFPDDPRLNSLDNWVRFEKYYSCSAELLNFWLTKKV